MRVQQLTWVVTTLLSHYRRHKLQTLFLLVGLITGVALWSAVQIINAHAKTSYAQADQLLGGQAAYWIQPRGKQGIDIDEYIKLRRQGFRQIFPVIEQRHSTPEKQPFTIIATDMFALAGSQTKSGQVYTSTLSGLSLISPPYEVWVPSSLAKQLNIEEGDSIQLQDGRTLPPVKFATMPMQGQRIFMDIGVAWQSLGLNKIDYLAVGELTPKQAKQLPTLLNASLSLNKNQQSLDLTELTKSLHIHLSAMSLLSFLVGLFIVFNAVRFSLHTRTQTFSSLRELGVSQPAILIALCFEVFILSIVATLMGIGLGVLLSQFLLPSVASTLQNLYGAVLINQIVLSFHTWLHAWLLSLGGLSLALAWPLWKQAQNSLRANREQATQWHQDALARKKLAWASLCLAVLAAIIWPNVTELYHGFILLALVLLSAVWLLPIVAEYTLHLFSKIKLKGSNPLSSWAISDGFAQLSTLRTALMALLLALVANFGVDTLVGSFRQALDDWLQQRLSADIYVQSNTLNHEALLASQPSWLESHHLRNGTTIRWNNKPTLIRGLNPSAPDVKQLPMAYPKGNGVSWDKSEPPYIFANEQVKHLAGIKLHEKVTLETASGAKKFTIAGFYHDYGNPYYQFYLPYNQVTEWWPYAQQRGLGLWLNNINQQDRAIEALIEFGAKPGDWIVRDNILKLSMNIFDRTFAMTAAINSLTFIVAGIALLASLMSIHQQRLSQYAHWHSMGVTTKQWLYITGLPLLSCVLITWLLSIPLGSLLAHILIHDINVLSFGWTMPLIISIKPAFYLLLLTLLVVVVAYIFSAWQVQKRLPYALKTLGN